MSIGSLTELVSRYLYSPGIMVFRETDVKNREVYEKSILQEWCYVSNYK